MAWSSWSQVDAAHLGFVVAVHSIVLAKARTEIAARPHRTSRSRTHVNATPERGQVQLSPKSMLIVELGKLCGLRSIRGLEWLLT